MAKLRVSNTKVGLPTYNRFTGSKPAIVECYFQNKPNENLNNRSYYYSGSGEPEIGDTIFLDINGIDKYTSSLQYVQFKEDINNYYYLQIVNSVVVTIEICPKITYQEFDGLDQTNSTICEINSFYPSDLTSISEVFYHNGDGQLPVIGDTIYNSTTPNDTLNNFVALFNILNDVYYYLYTDSSGVVFDIKTCSEPIVNEIPVRNLQFDPITDFINGDYTMFKCEIPGNPLESIYYKSEEQVIPLTGTTVYHDRELITLIQQKSYFIDKVEDTLTFMLVDNNGKVSYTTCQSFLEPPITDGYNIVRTSPTTCNNTGTTTSVFKLEGNSGDIIKIKSSFSGFTINNSTQTSNTGASLLFSIYDGNNTYGGPLYTFSDEDATTGTNFTFNLIGTLSFTMPSNPVYIQTVYTIHNPGTTTSANGSINIISINGENVTGLSGISCYGIADGSWNNVEITNPIDTNPEPEPEAPITNSFSGNEVLSICDIPRNLIKYYYNTTETIKNKYGLPSISTVIYGDSSLSTESIQKSKVIYLYRENDIVYYMITNGIGEYISIRRCDLLDNRDENNNLIP